MWEYKSITSIQLAKNDVIWTISPYGVIQIGKLFLNGVYDASKIIAVAGSEVKDPQYYKTFTGGSVKKFLHNNLKQDHVRVISGNVLTGTKIGMEGHVGFYDQLVSVIPEGDHYEFLGWITPSANKLSFSRAWGLLSFLNYNKEYRLDSNTRENRERLFKPAFLKKLLLWMFCRLICLKAIIAEDYDDMEALGIYEVIEEDLALCEFVDVSKHEVQAILREGIELMLNS